MIYVLEKDRSAVLAGGRPPEPLVLHVNAGDCLEVPRRNETDAPVSLQADLLAYDSADSSPVLPGRSGPTGSSPTPRWARRRRCCGTLATRRRALDAVDFRRGWKGDHSG